MAFREHRSRDNGAKAKRSRRRADARKKPRRHADFEDRVDSIEGLQELGVDLRHLPGHSSRYRDV